MTKILSGLLLIPFFLTRLSFLPRPHASPPLVAIVIENHEDARPFQKGLDHALVITEFLVEGLISRFVVLFSEDNLPEIVGPIRSLRSYFVDGLRPWTALFLYAGGSPDALENIEKSEISHRNGLFLPEHFIRNITIAEPHNVFLSKNAILNLLTQASPAQQAYSLLLPRGPIQSQDRPQRIRVNFFSLHHNVEFTYDPLTASYTRTNGSVVSAAMPHNILIIQAPIRNIGSYGRLDIPLDGTGSLLLFQSGKISTGTWRKDSPQHPFLFLDRQHQPLQFANGQVWIMVLETLERVRWE